jgi:hypothetical protein
MTSILAVINKPTGRGHLRCWEAFLFDTIVQSEVEQFMLEVHHSGHYFLTDPDELEKNEVGNLMYGKFWISVTPVHVKTRGVHTTFTIRV